MLYQMATSKLLRQSVAGVSECVDYEMVCKVVYIYSFQHESRALLMPTRLAISEPMRCN